MKTEKDDKIPYSCIVLDQCRDLQIKKANDYQSAESSVEQADYYIRGIDSIYQEMNTKMLRIKSILDKLRNSGNDKILNEPLTDSFIDLINYASFGVSWIDGLIPGQDKDKDLFNNVK